MKKRFPRTRGDGPAAMSAIAQASGFPPHSRGWTRATGEYRCRWMVSPALAGMDPD